MMDAGGPARGEAAATPAIMERGQYVPELCAAFPSVTPVLRRRRSRPAAAGQTPPSHIGMNWWNRKEDERRYVEYGSRFTAIARAAGQSPAS
jgi:hypothetical protein